MYAMNYNYFPMTSITLDQLAPIAVSPDPYQMAEPLPVKRRVCFAAEPEVVDEIPTMSASERADVWYTKVDLDQFKEKARIASRRIRRDLPLKEDSDCTRGLEQRVSLQRQKSRWITIKAVLEAQRRFGKGMDTLSAISKQCSRRAIHQAHVTGKQDFCDAYDLNDINQISKVVQKRRRCEEDEVAYVQPRRVRARTVQVAPLPVAPVYFF
mmetsp:Transcript_9230/g.14310  ORF Transcript_9230/g.14310 Transcript_9230/m.14310 type:complete len:211 (-) Transcript_9230:2-634(-)